MRGQLVAGGVHDVEVLGQRAAHRPRERGGAPVLHEPAADLVFDRALQLLDAALGVVLGEPLGERPGRHRPRRRPPGAGRAGASRSRFRSVRYR